MAEMNGLGIQTEASASSVSEFSRIMQEKPTLATKSKPGPYMMASLRNVLSSRKDIAHEESVLAPRCPSYRPNVVPTAYNSSVSYTTNMCTITDAMCTIENDIMTRVCNDLLQRTPPYSTGNKLRSVNVPTTSACCAHITTNGQKNSRNLFLPISVPYTEQIEKCKMSASYNKNVYINIADALKAQNVKVSMCSTLDNASQSSVAGVSVDTQEDENKAVYIDTVYMDTSIPVKSLVTTEVLQDLPFGDSRVTSSDGFTVGPHVSETYASAVDVFKKYGNTRVGENVTLTPTFFKRIPLVVSMSCPALGISNVVTDFSATRDHGRFGANHTTRIVEVVSNLVPFVNQCCEVEMGLNSNTVEDLVEDHDMPIATCGSIEHCFAHNRKCGVSAYISAQPFVLSTSILNTHNTLHGNNSESNSFPMEKKFIVYVAALFSTPVAST